MGTNTSTRKLSEELDIHDRTIRYRLSRLRKEGYLHPPTIQSHERKLGLGEYTIFVTSVPGKEQTLEKIFNDAQSIYFYNPTTGRYEGYVIYASYPLSNPTLVTNMVKELIKRGFIEDYHLHDVLDYKRRGCVIKRVFLGPPVDWSKWIKSIPRFMKRKSVACPIIPIIRSRSLKAPLTIKIPSLSVCNNLAGQKIEDGGGDKPLHSFGRVPVPSNPPWLILDG